MCTIIIWKIIVRFSKLTMSIFKSMFKLRSDVFEAILKRSWRSMKIYAVFSYIYIYLFLQFCIFTTVAFAKVAPIKVGENGWAVIRRIACELDQVFDIACEIESRLDSVMPEYNQSRSVALSKNFENDIEKKE